MKPLFSIPKAAKGAVIDGPFRYCLWRVLDAANKRRIAFLMLNPSSADASVDDPTLRRCIGFAKSLGYGRLDVVNLFALRATDPEDLWGCPDRVGPDNDHYVLDVARRAEIVVCGWGSAEVARLRSGDVLAGLRSAGLSDKLHCLGVTKNGSPRHPLYLPADARPTPYSATT